MTQETIAVIVAGMIQLVGMFIGLYTFTKNFSVKMMDKKAEVAVENATADKLQVEAIESSLDLHMRAVEALIDRDMKMIELNRRFGEFEAKSLTHERQNRERIDTLEAELGETKKSLDLERQIREATQRQLDDERKNKILAKLPNGSLDDTIVFPEEKKEK